MQRGLLALLGALILHSSCVSSAFSQSDNGQISGQVTDPQGLAVAGATTVVVNRDTSVKRETKTDESGHYSVASLPPGRYQIVVQAKGFTTVESEDITLSSGQSLVHNVQLVMLGEKATVSVEGGGTHVETSNAEVSGTLTENEVKGLGLNGRIAYQLIALVPGVSNMTGQDEGKTGVLGSAKYSVNGGRVEYNLFEVDGTDVLNNGINAARGGNTFIVNPSVDAIADMKVLTSSYGAMYGRTASGIVEITTKSGTPSFHGGAYEFLRNEMFNARNFFDQTKEAPLYRRNDFGFDLGGPLFIPKIFNTSKQKTFFFFSEEFRYEKTPVPYNQAVPSNAERTGDFSDVCPADKTFQITPSNKTLYPDCPVASFSPASLGAPAAYSRSIYNGAVPGQATDLVPVDPTSQALLSTGLLPAPNSASGCTSTISSPSNPACYTTTVSPSTYWREELFRIDQTLPSNQVLSFRYIHDAWDTTVLSPQWGYVQNSFPTVQNHIDGPGLSMVLSWVAMFKGFSNRLAFGYVADHITLNAVPGAGVSLSRPAILDTACPTDSTGALNCTELGPSNNTPALLPTGPNGTFFDNGYGGKIPALLFKGTNGAYGSHGMYIDTGYTPWKHSNPTYTLKDDASRTFGKHTWQFGVQATIAQQNELSASNGINTGNVQGILSFNTQGAGPSQIVSASSSSPIPFIQVDTTNAFANFLGGQIASFQQDSIQRKYYNRYKLAELYVQDDWRISPRLTLNLGFRLGLFGSWYNDKGTAYNWVPEAYDPSIAAGVFLNPRFAFLERAVPSSSGNSFVAVPLNPSNPDPAIINGLVQCGVKGVPQSCMSSHIPNPMPRFGFAWDVFGTGKTALRGGYGIFYEHGTSFEANSGSLTGSAPLTLSQQQLAPPSYQCVGAFGRLGTPCTRQYFGPNDQQPSITTPVAFPINVTSIPDKAVYPYVQQWNLSLQQDLGKGWVSSFAYVGSKGTHLTAVRDLNQIHPIDQALNPYAAGRPMNWTLDCGGNTQGGAFELGGGAGSNPNGGTIIVPGQPAWNNMSVACFGTPVYGTPFNPAGFRPFPTLGTIWSVANIADSRYNAFQLSVRRGVPPLVVGFAYTYSHSTDDSSDRADADFVNSYDLPGNKANSNFDQRHALSISYIYDLPLKNALHNFTHWFDDEPTNVLSQHQPAGAAGNGQPSELWNLFLDGWQLSGITIFQTGTPFSVINGGSTGGIAVADNAGVANYFGTGSYADCLGTPQTGEGRAGLIPQTFGPLLGDPGNFVAPRGLTFGDCGRNSLHNPSRINFNVSLLKHFKVFGERDLEFRAETFNIFNHTQFRIYDPSHPGNSGNNVISCYGGAAAHYSAAGGGGVDCLTGNSFLHPVDAHDPRILQFGLKFSF